jgi:multiple sugar transport system permease protein
MATNSLYWFGIRRKSLNFGLCKTATYALLIVGSIIFAIPFLWMVSTSLKEPADLFLYPSMWIPDPFIWRNYLEVYNMVPLLTFVKNTLVIVAFNVVGQLISSSLAAFGFARLRFVGRDSMFLLVLATMMLPGFVTMIQQPGLSTVPPGWRATGSGGLSRLCPRAPQFGTAQSQYP